AVRWPRAHHRLHRGGGKPARRNDWRGLRRPLCDLRRDLRRRRSDPAAVHVRRLRCARRDAVGGALQPDRRRRRRRRAHDRACTWVPLMSTAAVALVSAVIVQATAAAVDFSGYWIPDPGKSTYTKELKRADSTKSDAPPAPPGDLPAPPPLRIATGASEMVVEFIGDDGAPINTVRLATD